MPHECTNCGRVFADGSKQMLSGCPDCGGNKFQFKPASATETSGTETGATPDAAADPTPDAAKNTPPDTAADPTPDTAENTTQPQTTQPDDPKRDLSLESGAWPDHGYGSDDSPDPDPTDSDVSASDATVTPSTRADDASTRPTDSETTEPADAAATDPDVRTTPDDSIEDPAQASARSDVVSPDEIASGTPGETDRSEATGSSAAREDTDAPPDADGRVIEPTSDDRPDLEDLREELNEQFESIRIVAPGEYELNLMELYDRTEYIISLQEDGRYVIEVPDTWDTTPDPDES